jgi:hypothetical protein
MLTIFRNNNCNGVFKILIYLLSYDIVYFSSWLATSILRELAVYISSTGMKIVAEESSCCVFI